MSYLVDALKKAERERHENRRVDLRTLAQGGPTPQSSASVRALRWLVGGLVVCNVGLLAYLFLPRPASEGGVDEPTAAVAESPPTAQNASAPPPAPAEPAAADTVETPTVSARGSRLPDDAERTAPSPPPEAVRQPPAADQTARTAQTAESPTRDAGSSLRLSSTRDTAPRGQVTYSRTPLDDGRDLPPIETGRMPSSRPPANRGARADISINGHLYSTVPGRSFILVNGRRYHEGERLAEGPAVESIDATGATLNYRGERYHVEGPS